MVNGDLIGMYSKRLAAAGLTFGFMVTLFLGLDGVCPLVI